MKKTFLLGVGAQKAGTTWLFQYLRSHPDCAMGEIKEHAVLNTLLGSETRSARFSAKAERAIAALADAESAESFSPQDAARLSALLDNISGETNMSAYLSAFDRLLTMRPHAHLTGDITPEYCALDADQLRAARDAIEGRGYDLKVVFLMRDPLDRIYSAIRMADRNRSEAERNRRPPAAERFAIQGVAEWVEIRTRYEVILSNIDAAFDKDQVFLGFYETFFNNETLAQLTSFLGIRSHPADFSHKANSSPKGGQIDPEKIAIVREFYDATYSDCARRFGAPFISEIWPNA